MHVWRRKLVLCVSYKMKYLQNEAKKQKSVKEVTVQFSMIFQIRLKNNTINFQVICPFNNFKRFASARCTQCKWARAGIGRPANICTHLIMRQTLKNLYNVCLTLLPNDLLCSHYICKFAWLVFVIIVI
jgi:hypothetical protein